MILVVTSGATVTFKTLISSVINPEFWLNLSKLGYTKLILQYGNEIDSGSGNNISKHFFEAEIAKYPCYTWDQKDDNTFTLVDSKFQIEAFGFSNSIVKYVSNADLVVSHAGTGSIIDALKCGKRLIVVVNDMLMDNHQLEVASAFEKLHYCMVSSAKNLLDSIQLIPSIKFASFSSARTSPLTTIIYSESAR